MDFKTPPSEKHQPPTYSNPPLASPAPPATAHAAPNEPPAPDYNTPRTLHIYRDGLTHRHMTITDMDKSHPLYQMDQNSGSLFSSKPHMTISQPSSKTVIGTATFHNWSRTIDLEFHGRPVSFESEGIFTRA
ncbi:MAG: hypothetical protein LQ338_007993, partial [Usnochroma carphineum]